MGAATLLQFASSRRLAGPHNRQLSSRSSRTLRRQQRPVQTLHVTPDLHRHPRTTPNQPPPPHLPNHTQRLASFHPPSPIIQSSPMRISNARIIIDSFADWIGNSIGDIRGGGRLGIGEGGCRGARRCVWFGRCGGGGGFDVVRGCRCRSGVTCNVCTGGRNLGLEGSGAGGIWGWRNLGGGNLAAEESGEQRQPGDK